MAIDTADKRASVVAYKLPWGRVFPTPDGSLQEDRQHLVGEYLGIAAGTPPAGAGSTMLWHHHYGV